MVIALLSFVDGIFKTDVALLCATRSIISILQLEFKYLRSTHEP